MEPEAALGERVERRPAVERVTGDRMASVRQMHANLMTHPGARPRRNQGEIPEPPYWLDRRRGRTRASRVRSDG